MLKVSDSLIEAGKLNRLAGIVILAGGASKRMGTPKAELILPTGERLLDYHIRQALELGAALASNLPIMIADNGRGFTINSDLIKHLQSPIFHIADYVTNNDLLSDSDKPIETGGALVAIESALQSLVSSNQLTKDASCHQSWLLVISCDSLIPINDLWQKLRPDMTQNPDKAVICLADDHHLYPLLGLYRLIIEPDLKHYIDGGQRQVMRFIKPLVQPIPFAKKWQYLTNFNTPEDFDHACLALNDL
ncbi:molybdenum cofactor guanylyltransferase [Psychrobacter aquimaris]|uniref:molybdenum cofactor guanylyltransferase n=1 Tax=Psychrobacter aquimaris TaxID=292733 RepID=UPI003FD49A96